MLTDIPIHPAGTARRSLRAVIADAQDFCNATAAFCWCDSVDLLGSDHCHQLTEEFVRSLPQYGLGPSVTT